MPKPPTPLMRVRGLLAEERALAVLLPQARRLTELNRLFAKAVPPGLARDCRVAALDGETAVVFCGHGAAASRLRSQAATVSRALSGAGVPVAGLKVKVRADWAVPDRPAKTGMGPKALEAWRGLQGELSEGALKEAVAQLLLHHRT